MKVWLCDLLAVCEIPTSYNGVLLNPSHQSVCLLVLSLLVASQRLAKMYFSFRY
jgi:hypothetical protein